MKLAAIIGWPVSASLSPVIHRAAFEALGLDWTYVPLAIRPDALAEGRELLDTLQVDAANVTMPHKEGVTAWCGELSDLAARIGAVNTLVRREDGGWNGDNTDAPGFANFLQREAGVSPAKTLVVGAGGAARAIVVALSDAGSDVVVAARRGEQAEEVAALAGLRGSTAPWGRRVACDLVVQTTPLADDELPEAYRSFAKGRAAVELLYGRSTAFLEAARQAGVPAFDGLGMLLHQAALSFELWTGMAAPMDAMRGAVETELDRRRRL